MVEIAIAGVVVVAAILILARSIRKKAKAECGCDGCSAGCNVKCGYNKK